MNTFRISFVAPLALLLGLAACGGGGGTGGASSIPLPPPDKPAEVVRTTLSLVAGEAGSAANTDGTGAAARFQDLRGLVTDSAGNAYAIDGTTLRKISPAGAVTTLAGKADAAREVVDGSGAAARFAGPAALAIDAGGNLYVADVLDYGVNCFCVSPHIHVIRKVSQAGVVTTIAGTPGVFGSADGVGAAASFYFPQGLAVDAGGTLWVAERFRNTLRRISPAGMVSSLALSEGISVEGGLGIDAGGSFYVAGSSAVYRISPTGQVSVLAGTAYTRGATDGTGSAARFEYQLNGLALDKAGNVYVADTANQTVRKITPAGVVTTEVGKAGVKGVKTGALPGGLATPWGVAVDANGGLYVGSDSALLKAY